MSRKAKIWLAAALGFSTVSAVVWKLPDWIGVTGRERVILVGLLTFLGAVAAVVTAIVLTKRAPPPPTPKDPLTSEVDAALTQAERRLVDAKVARGRVLQRMPAVFVLGPRQNQKTSSVVRSGLQPELLAGDALRGAQVVPTLAINLWYAKQALLVEPGVDVINDSARRARLLHRLQPARLADAVARGEQAPRVALLCFGCDNFKGANARDAVTASARELREVLSDIARSYGVRLPVYVLFTKADELPGFKEYVKHFSRDEVREVLGATLAVPQLGPAAEYADSATRRVRDAFRILFESLAARRIDVLARGDAMADKLAAYQFPRELRKIEVLASDFLVELTRPSDLSVSPFVRGFYFSGVREVYVTGAAAQEPSAPEAEAAEVESATGLLVALPLPKPAAVRGQSIAAGRAITRREAEWVFLDRLYASVLLEDSVALGVTRGGARISFFRRAVLGTMAGAIAALLLAFLVSFASNRSLQGNAKRQLDLVAKMPAIPTGNPTDEELASLDSLGAVLDTLSEYAQDGPPLRLRWGLYSGSSMFPAVRNAYFRQFSRVLLDSTRGAIASRLRTLPLAAVSGENYDSTYARLKAYLITNEYADSSSESFLAPVLEANWLPRSMHDSTGQATALRHFSRYARELPRGNPYALSSDEGLLSHARQVLRSSASDEPIYKDMIGEASRTVPSINFDSSLGRAGGRTVVDPYEVPGAFTKVGWDSVYAALGNIGRYLRSEYWVMGPPASNVPPIDQSALVLRLGARYDSQYVAHWRQFVRSARVSVFGSMNDAAKKLGVLSSSQSPLLLLFALVNENVQKDSARIGRHFEPMRKIGALSLTGGPLATETMKPYLQELTSLGQKVQTAAGFPDKALAKAQYEEALGSVQSLQGAIGPIALGADREQWATLGLESLLKQPGDYTRNILTREVGVIGKEQKRKEANEAGAAFCQNFDELARKAPFATGGPHASASELAEILNPTGGALKDVTGKLAPLITKRGNSFVVGGNAGVAPVGRLLSFLGALSEIADAFYPPGVSDPQLQFSIVPVLTDQVPSVSVSFGRTLIKWDQRSVATGLQPVVWRPANDNQISVRDAKAQRGNVASFDGPWAPLTFFRDSRQWNSDGPSTYRFEVEIATNVWLAFRTSMTPAVRNVVRGAVFSNFPTCPTPWLK